MAQVRLEEGNRDIRARSRHRILKTYLMTMFDDLNFKPG